MSLRVVDVREITKPIISPIRNAYIDFSKMTISLVAVRASEWPLAAGSTGQPTCGASNKHCLTVYRRIDQARKLSLGGLDVD